MAQLCFFVFVLVGAISAVKSESFCIKGCRYSSGTYVINCTNAGLTEIPAFKDCPNDANVLDLSYNSISFLSDRIFRSQGWINLKKLHMRHSNVQNVDQLTFSSLKNLETLDLSLNEIHDLKPGTFAENTRLQSVDISGNPIETLGNELFSNNTQIQQIDASNCNISKVENKAFDNLERLTDLKLNGNRLQFLELDLKSNDRLRKLDIGNNPWHCDKKLNVALGWLVNKNPQKNATCLTPPKLKGKPLAELKTEDFITVSIPQITEHSLNCNTSETITKAVYETDYESDTCRDSSKILLNVSKIDPSTIHFVYETIEYVCTLSDTSHANEGKLCVKLLIEHQNIEQPKQEVSGTSADKWFLVGGLSTAAVLLCIFVVMLSYFVYRRHKRLKNESRTVSLAAELEREALITIVNPVQKPPRNVQRPSVTSTETELTEFKRSIKDDGSACNQSNEDLSCSGSVTSPSSHVDGSDIRSRTPDPSLVYATERKLSHASSVASTIPDILKQSGQHHVPPSPFYNGMMHQRINDTFPFHRPYSPAISRYGNFTMPRRVRNDSWSSTPETKHSHFILNPVSDRMGLRTTALGSSAMSLNKTESMEVLQQKLSSRIRPLASRSISTDNTKREKPPVPKKPVRGEGRPVNAQRRSWTGFNNYNGVESTNPSRNYTKVAQRNSLPPLGLIKNDTGMKLPPTPPPKPKKYEAARESMLEGGEDGTEV